MAITRFNHRVLNPLTLRFAGFGAMVDLEHVGRRSGRRLHTPLMAFRHDDEVTIALTYGSGVQWLKNVTAAGGASMRMGDRRLRLGPPRHLASEEGLARMPQPQRTLLRWPIRCSDYVVLEVLSEESA
jgi:deazaflavin-dependent oxidoreductase (nitroreductase family)